MNINIGIIGFGKMGMLHGALLNAMKDVRVTAITDTSRLVLRGFKSIMPNIKSYTSYKKMLAKEDLHAVVIATPPFTHVAIAKDALNKGLPFFMEKPLGVSYKDVKVLENFIRYKDMVMMVGFCSRHMPIFSKGKDLISSNTIGKVTSASAEMYVGDVLAPHSGWRYDKKISGGGVLIDLGIHMVDLLYYYFGNVYSVKASMNSIYSKNVEDEVNAYIIFENGVIATLASSWSNPKYRKSFLKMEIIGERGKITITDQTLDLIIFDNNGKCIRTDKFTNPDLYKGYYIDIGGSYYTLQMDCFIRALREKTISKKNADLMQALDVQKIVDLIYKSANQKKQLEMKEVIINE